MLAAFTDLLESIEFEVELKTTGDFDRFVRDELLSHGGQRLCQAADSARETVDCRQDDGNSRVPFVPDELSLMFSFSDKNVVIHFGLIDSGGLRIVEYRSEGYPLFILLTLDLVKTRLAAKVTFDYSLGSTVADCQDAASLAYEMLQGSVKAEGIKWSALSPCVTNVVRAMDARSFWEKMGALEEKLGITFCPSQRMAPGNATLLSRIYEGVVEGNVVGLGYRPESVTYDDGEGHRLPLYTKMLLVVPHIECYNIMGSEVKVRANIGLSGVMLRVIEEKGNEVEYGLIYDEDYLCTVLYTPVELTDDSQENANKIKEALLTPLPNGKHY